MNVTQRRRGRRRESRRALLIWSAALAGVAGLALAGCRDDDDAAPAVAPDQGRATAAAQTPKPGGVFHDGTTGAFGTLDPHNSPNGVNSQIVPVAYNYLLRTSILVPDQGILWDLGTSYEVTDPTSWTFKLRPDVMVAANDHGIPRRPLDAEDVKVNMERWADPSTGSPGVRFARGWVERVEAPDSTTVRVITKGPYAWVLQNMGNYIFSAIAPREWLASPNLKTAAVGGGPFVVKEWEPGSRSVVAKNPAYYVKERPYLEQYELRAFADQVTYRTAFVSGQVDEYVASNADEADELQKANKDLQRSDSTVGNYQGFWMNVRSNPWNDPRVRRAVARAINRKEFIQLLGRGKGEPIGVLPATMRPYAVSAAELEALQPFDVAEARRLFQAAGVKEFSFVHSTATVVADYATILVRQMAAAGVTATPQPLDPGAWVQGLFRSTHTATHLSTPEFSDPDFAMTAHASRGPIGSGNYDTGFSDAEVDAAIRKAAGTLDEQERIKAYHDAQRLILQRDPAWLTYFSPIASSLIQPHVRGVQRGVGQLGTAFRHEIWLDQ
ncbi:MAG: ABC transporter substrate-binding protein [Dehalococcoidia bacterium]